jgi:hypothetical protein
MPYKETRAYRLITQETNHNPIVLAERHHRTGYVCSIDPTMSYTVLHIG